MRILELNVEGFRSLKDISWRPGQLNVVIGPNGSGKSNLLRALELVSVSAKGGLGKYVRNAGGMEPLVWDGSAEAISLALKYLPTGPVADEEGNSFMYALSLNRLGATSAYFIGAELLLAGGAKLLERSGVAAQVFSEQEKGLVVPAESLSDEESLLSIAGGPFTHNRIFPAIGQQWAGWSIYHDLHVSQDAVIRQAAVARMEKRVDPDGQNLITVLHTLYTGDRDFKNEVNLAMRAAFGEEFEELVFPPAADQRIQLRVRWKSLKREQSAADLSDGTLRFLFLLAVLASPSAAPLIAIDEPETGLHPSMLPIVAEYAVEASRRSQVILTSHSPALLDAFAKGTDLATTVAAWEDGQTVLKMIDGAVLEKWLEKYSMGELMTSRELEEIAEAKP
jgi:predicted ATPase